MPTKLIIILLRPIIYILTAVLIGAFGYRFLKRMLTGIGVFLTVIAMGGLYVCYSQLQRVMDPYNFSRNEDVMLLIVAVVMTLLLSFCSILYLTMGLMREQNKEEKEETGTQKTGRGYQIFSNIMLLGIKLIPALAFIGFSLPLFFLEEPAGKIVGGIIEVISCIAAFWIIRSHIRETKAQNHDEQKEE